MSDNNKINIEERLRNVIDKLALNQKENGWKYGAGYNYIKFFGDQDFMIPNAHKVEYAGSEYGHNLSGALFYVDGDIVNGNIVYVTNFLAAMDVGNNINIYTESFTREDYRRKGLFKKGHEMLENALEQYYRTTDVNSIIFRVTLINPKTQGFLENYFTDRGYEKVDYEGDVGVIDLEKVVEQRR